MRYSAAGTWFKGNTHIHSTVSDGGKTFRQLARMYASKGYDFLFRTDHWQASNIAADPETYPLKWIDGVELDGPDHTGAAYHVVGLGSFSGLDRSLGLEGAMQQVHAQGGLLILAHPSWMGNSLEDVVRWPFDGVEIYNHVCGWLNGKENGRVHWHQALARNPQTLGFTVDDAHITPEHPGWNGGWTMVKAPACTAAEILAALRRGDFYGTCGPEFRTIESVPGRVSVQTSPVRFARLVGPRWYGQRVGAFRGKLLTEASFEVPADWPYAYVEIEDAHGRRAWTNTL